MKEQIMNAFDSLGFQLEATEDYGYAFNYEGMNYLLLENENDEDFLNIAIPGVMDITEENGDFAYRLMDKINSTVKYVKANKFCNSLCLFYERELFGGEDFEKLLSRMILHLEAAMNFFRKTMASIHDELENSDDGLSTDDTEETE